MTLDMDHLRQWIGRTEDAADVATAAPVACLAATLDRDDAEPQSGDALAPGAHWLYFLPRTRHSDLDQNGHAKKGHFLPPVPFERRMWAGGRMSFLAPLHIGDEITRKSEILDVSAKEGKSGPLVFVLVRHRISGPGGLAIEEEHDIVYRQEAGRPEGPTGKQQEAPPPADPPPTAGPPTAGPPAAPWSRVIEPDITMLFRYSALIFNAHRIHYDRRYVTEKEGYPGLIVHGPLIATLLMDLCRRQNPKRTLSRFDYRARGPIFDDGPFTLAGTPAGDGLAASLEARDSGGKVAMTASAEFGG